MSVGAAWIVVAIMILSNVATPLYSSWQTDLGFGSATLTAIFAIYIVGLLLTLAVAGQLSARFGSRPVLLIGIAVAMIACALFAGADTLPTLLGARFLAGVAVGIAVSTGIAAVVELGAADRRRRASLLGSMAMVFGAGLGPLLAGAMARWVSRPIAPIFTVELVILGSAALLALVLPFDRTSPESRRAWRPRLPVVPRESRAHLACGIATFGPGLTAVSFILSLGPSLLARFGGVSNPLIVGGVSCAMFLTATTVQLLTRSIPLRRVFAWSSAACVLSMLGLAITVTMPSAVPFLAAALLAGIAQGLGQLGGLTLIGLHVAADRRVEANAVLGMGAYAPAAAMPVACGWLVDRIGAAGGVALFAIALGAVALGAAFFVSRTLTRDLDQGLSPCHSST